VIKRCGSPAHSGMARRAICSGKCCARCGVHRIVGALPGRQMAAGISAVRRRDGQRVIIVDVAQSAGHVRVAIGQQESGRAVIENSGRPSRNRVARGAGRSRNRESGGHVIRHVSAHRRAGGERRRVAAVAIRRSQSVIVIDMARGAGRRRRRHVRSGQGESGRAVIEYRRGPAHCSVARRAICRCKGRSGSRVHRIIGGLPSCQMALRISATGRRDRQIVIVVDVARSAGQVGMAIGQQESSGGVVKRCRSPTDGVVAGVAIRHRKCGPGGRVYGVIGRLPSRQMAPGISAVRRRNR